MNKPKYESVEWYEEYYSPYSDTKLRKTLIQIEESIDRLKKTQQGISRILEKRSIP